MKYRTTLRHLANRLQKEKWRNEWKFPLKLLYSVIYPHSFFLKDHYFIWQISFVPSRREPLSGLRFIKVASHKEITTIYRVSQDECCSFGRVLLMLKYTDVTQNTYVKSWTVTEIMAREKCGLLAGPPTVSVSWQVLSMFVLECGVR
jgi:hypothetical protein